MTIHNVSKEPAHCGIDVRLRRNLHHSRVVQVDDTFGCGDWFGARGRGATTRLGGGGALFGTFGARLAILCFLFFLPLGLESERHSRGHNEDFTEVVARASASSICGPVGNYEHQGNFS